MGALVTLTVLLTGLAFVVVPSGAQTTTTLVPLEDQPLPSPSIIPAPNSTSQPTQYLVMLGIVVALAVVVLLVVRESRRKKDNRTHKPV